MNVRPSLPAFTITGSFSNIHRIVEWADLVTLDLSTFDQPGGKELLAKQLFDALQNVGFFYIVNFGLSQDEVDRQFAIGKSVFELPTDEKLKYRADLENGGYNGYKPLGLRVGLLSAMFNDSLDPIV